MEEGQLLQTGSEEMLDTDLCRKVSKIRTFKGELDKDMGMSTVNV